MHVIFKDHFKALFTRFLSVSKKLENVNKKAKKETEILNSYSLVDMSGYILTSQDAEVVDLLNVHKINKF